MEAAPVYSFVGQVKDAKNRQPIADAAVAVWEFTSTQPIGGTLKGTTKTDSNGSFRVSVESTLTCYAFVYHVNASTGTHDYLPQFRQILWNTKTASANIPFNLQPAATLIFEGDILFADSTRPVTSYNYTVIPEKGLWSMSSHIMTYGTTRDAKNRFINLNSNQVIVPAKTPLEITLKAVAGVYRTIVIDDPLFSNLSKGEEVRVSVGKYLAPRNFNATRDMISLAEIRLSEIEQKAFHIQAERHDLGIASDMLQRAEEEFTQNLYDRCNTDLREAYVKAAYISDKVRLMYGEASASVSTIIFFLSLTALTISYTLFDDSHRKVLATVSLFSALFATTFLVYPGSRIADVKLLLAVAALSATASLLISRFLPRAFTASTITIFSMAKHNLRTKKTRFLLTLITVTALVMGFVAFTSLSTEYGFTQQYVGNAETRLRGLLVKQPPPEIPFLTPETQWVATFNPIEDSTIEWLKGRTEVALTAPKVENYPTQLLGEVTTSNGRGNLYGVLGISPSAEAQITSLDKLIVEGRYLYDNESEAVLISAKAAENLNAKPGDRLTLRIGPPMGRVSVSVKLVGLFDDEAFAKMKDFDGALIAPTKIVVHIIDPGPPIQAVVKVEPCDHSEVIIVNWATPIRSRWPVLPYVSRVDVLVAEGFDLNQQARQIALEGDFWVWASAGGRINLMALTYYLEVGGASIIIPWLIVILNVVTTIMTAIYERRREIAVLSSVGADPSHISSLFGAEALIIGVIGGGVGYLLGLSLYQPITLLSGDVYVRQKISAVWTFASLGVAVTAVLAGAYLALRSSIILTPSFLRRWKAVERTNEGRWLFDIPVSISEDEVDALFNHIHSALQGYNRGYDILVDRMKETREETPEAAKRSVSFTCSEGNGPGKFMSRNNLTATKKKTSREYTLQLDSKATEEKARATAKLIREFLLNWNIQKTDKNPTPT